MCLLDNLAASADCGGLVGLKGHPTRLLNKLLKDGITIHSVGRNWQFHFSVVPCFFIDGLVKK